MLADGLFGGFGYLLAGIAPTHLGIRKRKRQAVKLHDQVVVAFADLMELFEAFFVLLSVFCHQQAQHDRVGDRKAWSGGGLGGDGFAGFEVLFVGFLRVAFFERQVFEDVFFGRSGGLGSLGLAIGSGVLVFFGLGGFGVFVFFGLGGFGVFVFFGLGGFGVFVFFGHGGTPCVGLGEGREQRCQKSFGVMGLVRYPSDVDTEEST